MTIGEHCPIVSVGAALGALPAVFDRPLIGLAVVVVFSAFFGITGGSELMFGPRALSLGKNGIQVYFRGSSFSISWALMTGASVRGADLYTMAVMHVANRTAIVNTVVPDNPSARARVIGLISSDGGDDGDLTLPAWLGGMDATTLVRSIRAFSSTGTQSPHRG